MSEMGLDRNLVLAAARVTESALLIALAVSVAPSSGSSAMSSFDRPPRPTDSPM